MKTYLISLLVNFFILDTAFASPVTPEVLMKVVKLTNKGTTDQGTWLLYSVERSLPNENGFYASDVTALTKNIISGATYTFPKECANYMWNPSDKTVIGVCGTDERAIWTFSKEGEKIKQLLTLPQGLNLYSVSPEGQFLLLGKDTPLYNPHFASLFQDMNVPGRTYYLSKYDSQTHLFTSPQRIEAESLSYPSAQWSQNSKLLLPVIAGNHESYKSRHTVQLTRYDPYTRISQPFSSPPMLLWDLHFSPDGEHVAALAPQAVALFESIERMINSLTVLSIQGKVSFSKHGFKCVGWLTPDTFLISRIQGTVETLDVFNLEGTPLVNIPLSPDSLQNVSEVSVETPNIFTFKASSIDHPEEIYRYNQKDGSLLQLTKEQSIPLTPTRVEVYSWDSFDGKPIEGLLIYPSDFTPHYTYPVVADLHGGPPGYFTQRFQDYWHLFSERGYFVFLPNVRGSGGYGEEFKKSVVRETGDTDIKDILWGVKSLEKDGLIDPQRMSIQGHSYGGYLTAQMISLNNMFRSAIVLFGPLFYPASAGTSDFDAVAAAYLGSPQENWALWLERSPLTRAASITTPTSFIHGFSDVRVAPIESAMMAYVMTEMEKPVSGFLSFGSTHTDFTAQGHYKTLKEMVEFHTQWNPPSQKSEGD